VHFLKYVEKLESARTFSFFQFTLLCSLHFVLFYVSDTIRIVHRPSAFVFRSVARSWKTRIGYCVVRVTFRCQKMFPVSTVARPSGRCQVTRTRKWQKWGTLRSIRRRVACVGKWNSGDVGGREHWLSIRTRARKTDPGTNETTTTDVKLPHDTRLRTFDCLLRFSTPVIQRLL